MAEEVIGGYKLVNVIASGQSSWVWEVVEVSSNRHFAMKRLLPEKKNDQQAVKLLIHEAKVGKKLQHPHIIKIVHTSIKPENPYYVMEYFPAGSLGMRLLRKEFDFIKENARHILKKCMTALAYMNGSKYVHRDVKPDNFLVNAAREVRLIDFAIAKKIEKPPFWANWFPKKRTTRTAGTRSYMSPEQILNEALDGRADIYSFGASMYELFTGRLPFVGDTSDKLLMKHLKEKPMTPESHNPELHKDFAKLILQMLEKKRENRPKDFHEVMMRLQKIRIYKGEPKPRANDMYEEV
ncbi:MAG: serine/threonine protein kinase [Gemmataceae bacterium]